MAEQPGTSSLRNAEQVYMSYRRRRAAGEAVDLDTLCEKHAGLEENLRFLDSVYCLGQSAGSTASFRDVLKERFGDDAVNRLSIVRRPTDAKTTEPLTIRDQRNRYVFGSEIGRGGMSRILEAWDRDLNRTLAVKVQIWTGERSLLPDSIATRRTLERFVEEAHITAQLDHPGIVPIHDVGFDDEGRIFFTMRLVKGRELGAIIEYARREQDGWNLTRVLGVFIKICETVAFAHAKGVIHRDLKPANIMIGKYGETYVMDWGLAKIMGCEDRHAARLRFDSPETLSTVRARRTSPEDTQPEDALATPEGTVVGTPVFMSPEQAAGAVDEVNQRSDVYSLGAILYGLLAGRPPYVPADGRISPVAALGRVTEGPPKPILEVNPSAPRELVAICETAMARDPKARYQTSLELAEALQTFLDRHVVRSTRAGAISASGRRPWWTTLVAAATTLTVVAVTLAALFFAGTNPEPRSQDVVLADLQRLGELEREADALWPATSENVDALARWLRRARTWAESAVVHRDELVDLDADEALQADLERLVQGLETFTSPDPFQGAIASVEKRLEFARGVRKSTVDDMWDRWLAVGVPPQEGLIPLGRNRAGLWEFSHAATGRAPGPGRGDGTQMERETGLVFVLINGPDEGERFLLSKYPMTRAQWERAVGPLTDGSEDPLDPVTNVSWSECDRSLGRLGLTLPTTRQWRHASTNALGLHDMLDVKEWCRDGVSGRDTFVSPDDRAPDVRVRPARTIAD